MFGRASVWREPDGFWRRSHNIQIELNGLATHQGLVLSVSTNSKGFRKPLTTIRLTLDARLRRDYFA